MSHADEAGPETIAGQADSEQVWPRTEPADKLVGWERITVYAYAIGGRLFTLSIQRKSPLTRITTCNSAMKTTFRHSFATISVVALCLTYSLMTTADENQPSLGADAFAVRTSISLWNQYFQRLVHKGDPAGTVKEALAHKSLDWGRETVGGTGNYALYFKLDDLMLAEFKFDASDKLESYTVFRQPVSWIKDPEGNILYQIRK
jgi:hypothetical protein